MYYRVKKYKPELSNMFVLDRDNDFFRLKLRTEIDCSGIGGMSFSSSEFIESQEIKCISLGGTRKATDIIKSENK